MKRIKYLGCFLNPTESQKLSGADVTFCYEDYKGNFITVLACQNGECWQQWGAEDCILSHNVERVQAWFNYVNNIDNDCSFTMNAYK